MGGGGGKGFGDWAMLASNPVQAVIPEIFGIRDWDPISSGFAYVTGKAFGEDTSGYKPTYAGGPGYQTQVERVSKKNQDAWSNYYKAQQEAFRSQMEQLQKQAGIRKDKEVKSAATPAAPSLIVARITKPQQYGSLLEEEEK